MTRKTTVKTPVIPAAPAASNLPPHNYVKGQTAAPSHSLLEKDFIFNIVTSFSFIISKEACFAYWLQSLVRWSWYFEKKEHKYYLKFIEPLTEHEKKVLSDWKFFLEDKEIGFLWLWQRYAEQPIVRKEDRELIGALKSVFQKKFESFWKNEKPFLKHWKLFFSKYPIRELEPFLSSVHNFLDSGEKQSQSIKVLLMTYADNKVPAGHTNRHFPNIVILNVSHVEKENINAIINVLVHETAHLFEHRSLKTEQLLKNSFARIIAPTPFKKRMAGPKWRHLLTETVITSIAGRNLKNYFSQKTFEDNRIVADDENITKEEESYSDKIRFAAQKLLPFTADYFENAKIMDQKYCDIVAKIWVDFYQTNPD